MNIFMTIVLSLFLLLFAAVSAVNTIFFIIDGIIEKRVINKD